MFWFWFTGINLLSVCYFAFFSHVLAYCDFRHLISTPLFYHSSTLCGFFWTHARFAWRVFSLWYVLRRHYEILQIWPNFFTCNKVLLASVQGYISSRDPAEFSTEEHNGAFDIKMNQVDWIFGLVHWKNLFIMPPDFSFQILLNSK